MERTSIVGFVFIGDDTLASTVHIGDTVQIKAKAKALAVQRQIATFLGSEGDLSLFPIFSIPLPQPVVTERIDMTVRSDDPAIRVDRVHITSVSSSSIFQIGSNVAIDLESRVKHIRQIQKIAESHGGGPAASTEATEVAESPAEGGSSNVNG